MEIDIFSLTQDAFSKELYRLFGKGKRHAELLYKHFLQNRKLG